MAFISPGFPEAFAERLRTAFNNRLRIRWSTQLGEWQIEQKVRRGFFDGQRPKKRGWDESSDDYVRYRDGYIHVLSVRTGDRMPCPRCEHELRVPFNRTEVVSCPYCRLRGRQTHIPAMFVPLNDVLIQYLKKIDPENPASLKLAEEIDERNQRLAATQEKDALAAGTAEMSDAYNRIVGIPQVGYTGKEKMWSK